MRERLRIGESTPGRASLQARAEGLDAWRALEEGLALIMPRRVARVMTLEPRLWVCLLR